MKRDELINQVEWNSGGYGFGVCSVANSMMWAMDEPSADKPDLKSTVAICGDPAKYTDEELEKIVAFAKRRDEKYDSIFRYRRGCNMILIGKEEDNAPSHRWMRKRLTWNMGPMHSPTLEEAIAVMER